MSERPYAIPVDDLVTSAKVDVVDQIEEQSEPRLGTPDWSTSVSPYADGTGGDADGD